MVSCQETSRTSPDRFDPEKRAQMAQEAAAFLRLSELHFANGYREYGLADLKRAYMKNPYDQESFVRVTKILEDEEDWETLVDFFNYAIYKYGAHAILYRNVGICHYRIGEYHKAANSFRFAVALESINPQNYVYLAQTYEKLNKPEDALSTWKLLLIILDRLPMAQNSQEFREQAENNKEKLERSMGIAPSG
jgi:tetratricopeptide (TPR) repeat protein